MEVLKIDIKKSELNKLRNVVGNSLIKRVIVDGKKFGKTQKDVLSTNTSIRIDYVFDIVLKVDIINNL